jgi:hypothetical protein
LTSFGRLRTLHRSVGERFAGAVAEIVLRRDNVLPYRRSEVAMTDDVKTMHHMILVWNAFATPPVIPPQMLRNLGDYLANFLKSNDGEQYLRTLGYVRAGAPGKPV